MQFLSELSHFVNVVPPIADVFDTSRYSTSVDMSGYNKCTFVVQRGVGTTGTSVITVEATDGSSPLNVTAITFRYRKVASTDIPGALTAATSAGYTQDAGSNLMDIIEVDARDIAALAPTYHYLRLKATESVNSPVLGGITAILTEPRMATDTQSVTD